MSDAADSDDVSGGSIAAAERAMRRGRGRMLVAMGAAVVVAVGALAFAMRDDDGESYRSFGRRVNGLDAAHFDGFLACALQGSPEVGDDEALRRELHRRAGNGKNRYGRHLRSECLPELAALEEGLGELIPPAALHDAIASEREAAHALAGAASDYAGYLESLGGESAYDAGAAADSVDRIARAWYDFRHAHADVNQFLREELAER